MWETIKNILAKRLVSTIGNLLKKLKLPVFITNSSTFVKSVERLSKLMLSKMKQYLSPEQTAKLIELGFEKPSNTQYIQRAKARNLHSPFIEFGEPEFEGSYSIGELIEILDGQGIEIKNFGYWIVEHEWYTSTKDELIDALYDCIVKLKELKKL